jgi:serine/threonine protein kinase
MKPSEQLEGMTLDNNWQVVRRVAKRPTATGGHFSTGYIVKNADGRDGFLKAIDYSEALRARNTPELLNALTSDYLFEKSICEKCNSRHLSRVARAVDSGSLADNSNPLNKVDYLIFELANGDIRAHLDAQESFDAVFALRTLHHVATALKQLHSADIAHQDLKPSNVLVFAGSVGSKVGDLGRAWSKDTPARHDPYKIAGDMGYAPPETLYGDAPVDAGMRRFGCDLYHLGSLAVFFFTRVHMNSLFMNHLHPDHRPTRWGGSFVDVLPHVYAAIELAMDQFSSSVPEPVRSDLRGIVNQLCEPDPARRGHPSDRCRSDSRFSLHRYVSQFDLLAYRLQYKTAHGYN